MRPHSRETLPKLVAVALVLALSGCAPTPEPAPPAPVPAPTASFEPVFASNEEALAAATEAYAAYEEVARLIFSEGGVDADRLRTVATGDFADNEIAGYRDAVAQGIRLTGANSFDQVVLQRVDEKAPNGVGVVVVYLCSDLSKTDVLDINGNSVVAGARPDLTPFEVSFDWTDDLKSLVVGDRAIWMGGGVC